MSTPDTPVAPSHVDSPPPAPPPHQPARRKKIWIIGGIVVVILLVVGLIWFIKSYGTVSTDDAYVNGRVTFVAARVAGQVSRVLVDDNNRVRKGDLLVQLDKVPYEVQLNVAQAAVAAAQADVVAAEATARGMAAQARSLRFNLEHAVEEVDNQVAVLRSKVATLNSRQASLAKAQSDYDRALPLVHSGAIGQEELDRRQQVLEVSKAEVEEAVQGVYQVRASLGLPPKPAKGNDLAEVPADLDQTFSSVRQAQASLIQAAAQIGVTDSFNKSPKEMVADFYKRDPQGDIDRIYAKILKDAPAVRQAEARLAQAQRNLDQASLNLRYTDIVAEIDGVVTRREVNPGNNVVVGQSLMALRSLTEIWIDANFKETQLGSLRIGQPVDLDVDMYGSRRDFNGRISGFTMGTGSTLALLPAENATGNFVKVVQRLPVRIELTDYDPDKVTLFTGLSVTATVHVNGQATGQDAGGVLQPLVEMDRGLTTPTTLPAAMSEGRPTTAPATMPGSGS